jgi:hypothetical protein
MKRLIAIFATTSLLAFGLLIGRNATAASQIGCLPPPLGLIGWWPLDETTGSTATDIVGGNDGAHVGGPTPVTGYVAGALSFDGIDDEVQVNSTFPFHQPGNATLEFWLNTPATGHQSVFWTRADDADLNRFNIFVNGDSTFGFDYRSPSGALHILVGACCTGVSIPRNSWTHLGITRTGNVYKLYVNGSLAASATDALPDLPTATGWQMSGRGGLQYQGSLDEVEVYDRALSDSEILAIYNAGSAGKCKAVNVRIDIKPGSDPNSLNCANPNEIIAVAILTTKIADGESIDFDASTVDPLTARFGKNGSEAAEAHNRGHIEDVDGDGDLDLVLHFRLGQTGIQCGDTSANFTGRTFDNRQIRGSDSIRTVGN